MQRKLPEGVSIIEFLEPDGTSVGVRGLVEDLQRRVRDLEEAVATDDFQAHQQVWNNYNKTK